MPAADVDLKDDPPNEPQRAILPFPPLTSSHLLHCSIHYWHPLFKTLTPKTRLVPLSDTFIDYLRSDGILLPPEDAPNRSVEPDPDWDDEDEEQDPSLDWSEVHQAISTTIKELGGRVHPKLNWSAPKDATWIATANTMECLSANDIYLLLKSSDFITHDLEQALDGCILEPESAPIPYHLALRKSIPSVVTSMEFRCFVKYRTVVGICQRDLNYYEFMPALIPTLQKLILTFFDEKLTVRFPDPNFVFDVYIPQPKERGRVWLIDINPWAPRTDPLLFSWMELLSDTGSVLADDKAALEDAPPGSDTGVEEIAPEPEFRVVKRDDPEAYSFNTPLYSAHKLPKDVVDAGLAGGGGIRDFLNRWNDIKAEAEKGIQSDSE